MPGTYAEIDIDKSLPHQFYKLWNAPTNGLYGIENEAGNVSVDNTGFLYGSAQIFLFVLAIGAFISVTMKTGAIQTGIGRLALRFRHSPALLIVVLMAVFALGGTTEGMWEETLGFFVLLVPLALALGFDRMTGAAIVFLGAGSGVLASTVNPFATGVASDAAGIGVGDGIGLRVAMWFVIVGAAIAYVLRYAYRVRRDPARSVLGVEGLTGAGLKLADEAAGEVEPLTGRQKFVLVALLLGLRGDDLRLRPVGRHLGHDLRRGVPAADVHVLLLRPGDRAVHRHGGRDRAGRQARRGGHGHDDHRRRRRTSSAPR